MELIHINKEIMLPIYLKRISSILQFHIAGDC